MSHSQPGEHKQDMEKEFSSDPLLNDLKQSGRESAPPVLDERILYAASEGTPRKAGRLFAPAVALGAVAALVTVIGFVGGGNPMAPVKDSPSQGAAKLPAYSLYGEDDTPGLRRIPYFFTASDSLQAFGDFNGAYLLGPGKAEAEILNILIEYFDISGTPKAAFYQGPKYKGYEYQKPISSVEDATKRATTYLSGSRGAIGFSYSGTFSGIIGDGTEGRVPTKTDAIAEIIGLSGRLGLKVAASDVHFVLEGPKYLSATVKLKAQGNLTAMNWTFTWQNGQDMTEFSGVSTTIIPQETGAIVSPIEAVQRANTLGWGTEAMGSNPNDWYQQLQEGLPDFDSARDSKGRIPVRITKVERGIGQGMDADGVTWLLPSYLLYTDDGYAGSVIAVRDFKSIRSEENPAQ